MNKDFYEKPKLIVVNLDEDIVLTSPSTTPAPCTSDTVNPCGSDTYCYNDV